MNSLLFNLLFGTLMVVPDLSKGQKVVLDMPEYPAAGKEVRIKCSYSNIVLSTMEFGASNKIMLLHVPSQAQGKPTLIPVSKLPGLRHEVQAGSKRDNATVIFIFDNLECKDLGIYVCIVNNEHRAEDKILKIPKGIDSLTSSATEPSVNEVLTLTCKGTVNNKFLFDVEWYRDTISSSNKLAPSKKAYVKRNEKCTRKIESQLSYTVKKSDAPKLTLWCRILNDFSANESLNFTINAASQPSTTLKPNPKAGTTQKPNSKPDTTQKPNSKPDTTQKPNSKPDTTQKPNPKLVCKSDPKPDCKPEPHFPNSAASNKTKTLVIAFNSILFLFLFSSLN